MRLVISNTIEFPITVNVPGASGAVEHSFRLIGKRYSKDEWRESVEALQASGGQRDVAFLLESITGWTGQSLVVADDGVPVPFSTDALRLLLKDGLPRKEKVAEKFHMTVRTLQRHLQQAGTSYQEILDQLRQELAEHYLLRSDLAIQDIASYLGFTESRSFHRSFKAWTGMTPGEYRERRKGAPL